MYSFRYSMVICHILPDFVGYSYLIQAQRHRGGKAQSIRDCSSEKTGGRDLSRFISLERGKKGREVHCNA
ncbi:MAG: hypothetical protein SVY10_14570 [Thermodesulfobacteriota bacterium]|nr:hypothetical protein [Thermodesulfobacteriota bacterium]